MILDNLPQCRAIRKRMHRLPSAEFVGQGLNRVVICAVLNRLAQILHNLEAVDHQGFLVQRLGQRGNARVGQRNGKVVLNVGAKQTLPKWNQWFETTTEKRDQMRRGRVVVDQMSKSAFLVVGTDTLHLFEVGIRERLDLWILHKKKLECRLARARRITGRAQALEHRQPGNTHRILRKWFRGRFDEWGG